MPIHDLQCCASFVATNRSIAQRFSLKAKTLHQLIQSLDDVNERMRIADVALFSESRAAAHALLAERQQRDLGVKCHCLAAPALLAGDVSTVQ